MNFIDAFMEKWNRFSSAVSPVMKKTGVILAAAFDIIVRIWNYVAKFRKIFFAVPVGIAAVYLAMQNMTKLPANVGLFLQSDGEYMFNVVREIAVLGPMAITAFCLLLMFCSRRILTPWIVSVMTLALPLLILLTNTFPV